LVWNSVYVFDGKLVKTVLGVFRVCGDGTGSFTCLQLQVHREEHDARR